MSDAPICLISAEYPPRPGGVGDYTACLATALAEAGRTVHVITSAGPGSPGDGAPGLTVHRAVADWRWPAWGAIDALLGRIRPAVAGIQYQTGAYHLHGAINTLPWRVRPPGLAWVSTFHDLRQPYLFPKAGPLRRLANEALMRASRAVIVTNPQDAAALPRWARTRAAGIPIGANIAVRPPPGWDRRATRAAYSAGPETTLIAYFGFFNASKGLDVLLAALAALRTAGRDCTLLLVGGGGGATDRTNSAMAAALREQITGLGLATAVHWTGYRPAPEISAALLAADLAALPFRDGASLRHGSLLAVLAHGLPLVTTAPAAAGAAAGRWPALVDGENALLVRRGEAPAVAHALGRLADDPALRRRLTAGATALAAEFRWSRIAAAHLALFDRLQAPGEPARRLAR